MIFSTGYGGFVFTTSERPSRTVRTVNEPLGQFNYFFPDATDLRATPMTLARLERLAAAFDAREPRPLPSRSHPPILPFLCQLIRHDLAAAAEVRGDLSDHFGREPAPCARVDVADALVNLRTGALHLESLYGAPSTDEPWGALSALLRSPADAAKMRLGSTGPLGQDRVPLPQDGAADVPRLGSRMGNGSGQMLVARVLASLPKPVEDAFTRADGRPVARIALIADQRNDETLALSQLHSALLRFHNAVVEQGRTGGPAEGFQRAQRQVRFTIQWLVVNEVLPRLCDRRILEEVIARRAPLYTELTAHAAAPDGTCPIPMEFAAAVGFAPHSMVRATFDWNRFFGAAVPGVRPILPAASVELLARITGNSRGERTRRATEETAALPANWVAEWDRLAPPPDAAQPDRAALRLGTDFVNAPMGPWTAARSGEHRGPLAASLLQLGFLLNVPTAQDCLSAATTLCDTPIKPLTQGELTAGPIGDALADGLSDATPLWFYTLREAEVQGDGERLGGLGSLLFADTLFGVIINDRQSYWHHPGSDAGRWHPRDDAPTHTPPVTSLPALLTAAGLLPGAMT